MDESTTPAVKKGGMVQLKVTFSINHQSLRVQLNQRLSDLSLRQSVT
ncbi:MAG: hypothetical protein HLUCCA11_23850 [Phormidesmis priestleyi Ana]|uniref:Uncharacterized protein n=1 Tax=Phormidesmis priestleyi Ana TaxID=1666911 RepID=A0A0P8D5V7_9CYAN|nr:MAG: hypothetical protein HLUCCA11_23850 [Phormidesmis priestleyi Ana]